MKKLPRHLKTTFILAASLFALVIVASENARAVDVNFQGCMIRGVSTTTTGEVTVEIDECQASDRNTMPTVLQVERRIQQGWIAVKDSAERALHANRLVDIQGRTSGNRVILETIVLR